MSALDEVLFADESIVDCRAELEGEKLTVTALAAVRPRPVPGETDPDRKRKLKSRKFISPPGASEQGKEGL